MSGSRYENVGRIHLQLNDQPLEEVDCSKCMGISSGSGWRM